MTDPKLTSAEELWSATYHERQQLEETIIRVLGEIQRVARRYENEMCARVADESDEIIANQIRARVLPLMEKKP